MKRILPIILFCAIFALYLAVRLQHLTDSCLWFDEIFSIHAARTDWNYFFSFIAQDLIHPPFFYLLLKFWLVFFGESLFAVRFFAVFFSALAIIPFILLGRELKLTTLEICAALLAFAVNGSLIKYAQEVRMYSLLLFLALVSTWLFTRRINKSNDSQSSPFAVFQQADFVCLLLVNILLIYTHYFGGLIILAEIVAAVWLKKNRREIFLQIGIVSLAFAPWLYEVATAWLANRGLEQNLNGTLQPDFQRLWEFVSALHQPFYYVQSSADSSALIVSVPLTLICFCLVTYGIFRNRQSKEIQVLLIFFIVPFFVSFAASWILPLSVWGIRHLTIMFPAYFLLLIISFRAVSKQLKIGIISVLLIFISINGWREFSRPRETYIWCAWENLAADVVRNDSTAPTVYAFEDLVAYHLWFASKNQFRVIKIDGYADLPEDKGYFLPRGFNDVQTADKTAISGDHFWLAFRQESLIPNKQILRDLQNQDYTIGTPFRFEAQGVTAFMIPVTKNSTTRSTP